MTPAVGSPLALRAPQSERAAPRGALRPVRAPRVGIPRAMGYYEHGGLWAAFFRQLGCEVVLSDPTDRDVLDDGVRAAISEFCLPVKVLLGHVRALAGKVDFIFMPRVLSSAPGEMSCPKACALPDLARFAGRTEVVEADVDPDRFQTDAARAVRLEPVAARLGVTLPAARQALTRARDALPTPRMPAPMERGAVALLGHPYVLHDPCLTMCLPEKLKRRGYAVPMPEDLPRAQRRADVRPYTDKAFYTIGLDVLGAAHAFARMPGVRGVIYLSPFSCGIDAMAAAHVENHLRAQGVPFMKLTVDEQTGEAGFDTRVEAFLDMLGEKA